MKWFVLKWKCQSELFSKYNETYIAIKLYQEPDEVEFSW